MAGAMAAGRRNRRIVIERKTETGRDALNTPIVDWLPIDAVTPGRWAAVYFGAGREQREAAQVQASQAASFEVLHDPATKTVTEEDRVIFDDAVWDINSVAPIGLNEGVKINAVRAAS